MSLPMDISDDESAQVAVKRTSPDGAIRFEVDKVSALDGDGRYSNEIEVRGVPWRVRAIKWKGNLLVYLIAAPNQSTLWRIDGDAEFIAHSVNRENVTVERSFALELKSKYKYQCLLKWNEVIDEEKGFIKDNKITVEVRFWISNIMGIRRVPRFNFTEPNEPSHDVAFVIGGKMVYASKAILAVHSPVFSSMFYGEYAENKREIELTDVDREEFIEMLHVIYPSSKKITAASVAYLLKLADRFQIDRVLERAEEYLMIPGKISKINMLKIADQYRLFGLKEFCLSAFKSTKEFKDIKESSAFNALSAETKILLSERALTIS